MPDPVNGYTTTAKLRTRLNIDADDESEDSLIADVITAVSRQIDEYCNRRFYAATQTRYFTAEHTEILFVDDLLSITTLKTDDDGDRTYETTWATTDYDLLPFNATLESQAQPYTSIEITPSGKYSFPTTRKGVEIAGSWGFSSSTPAAVEEACLIQSGRIYKRKDSPIGVLGSETMGFIRIVNKMDPDVERLLAGYRKLLVI